MEQTFLSCIAAPVIMSTRFCAGRTRPISPLERGDREDSARRRRAQAGNEAPHRAGNDVTEPWAISPRGGRGKRFLP
jgi:hypothetical protein